MPKGLTQAQFIERAKAQHGDTYDYSVTEYKRATEPVRIKCPIHGVFSQFPFNHLKGVGCSPCAYARISSDKVMTMDEFILKATATHLGRYDYSRVHYTRALDKVEIGCPIHGYFRQRANNHLAGIGCNKCAVESKRMAMLKRYIFADENSKLKPTDTPSLIDNQREFLCDCGRTTLASSYNVASGKVKSCGGCSNVYREVWLGMNWGFLRLDETEKLPEEWSPSSHLYFWFLCCNKGCGKRTRVLMADVTRGHTISCGCAQSGMSSFSPAGKIYTYLLSFAPDAEFSHWFKTDKGDREYDIFIPSRNVAIEYHGLQWHTDKRVGKNDWEKYLWSKHNGIRLIQIYSDEWETKQEIIKALLKDLIAPEPKIRITPKFSVEFSTSPEVHTFLNQNHYLGAASGCVTVVARHREAIVGAWVFMKRETGVVLWHRACWDRAYKSWNPHEKALKLALPALREMGFTKIVTFSDNRFHTGELYEKLGFKFEEELKPDYGYTDGNLKRKSKFALRVPAGVNEVEAAAKKGWFRVYDSGKRRYSMAL